MCMLEHEVIWPAGLLYARLLGVRSAHVVQRVWAVAWLPRGSVARFGITAGCLRSCKQDPVMCKPSVTWPTL
jgi:hypothetical protein